MMSKRELAAVWIGSAAYTAYVVAVAFLMPAILGIVPGIIAAIVLSIGPVIAASFWALTRT